MGIKSSKEQKKPIPVEPIKRIKPVKIVRQYSYLHQQYNIPYFIVIEDRTPGKGYTLSKFLTDDRMHTWVNKEGVIKIWFNPEYFPPFEYVAAKLSITPVNELTNAIAELLYKKKALQSQPLNKRNENKSHKTKHRHSRKHRKTSRNRLTLI